MQINQLTPAGTAKSRKRVGRGGKRGTYSGHGGKGQTARAGRNFRPIVREILKRYHKLRGYKNRPVGEKPQIVSVKVLESNFSNGQIVSPKLLTEKKLVSRVSGKYPAVKIVGTGEITKKLEIKNCAISESAKEKVEKAGGTIK